MQQRRGSLARGTTAGLLVALSCLAACGTGNGAPMPLFDGGAPIDGGPLDGGPLDGGDHVPSPSDGSATLGPGKVWFASSDLQTAVGQTVPALELQHAFGASFFEADLAAVLATVRLRTWPELAAVDARPGAGPVTFDGNRYTSRIDVTASAALADRWYVLSASVPSALSSRLAWDYRQVLFLPSGEAGVRFRVGSEPFVRAVTLCEAPTREVVIVSFSEAVTRQDSLRLAITQAPRTAEAVCPIYQRNAASALASCSGLAMSDALELRVTGQVVGTSGVGWTDGASALGMASTALDGGLLLRIPLASGPLSNFCRDYYPLLPR